MQDAFRKIKKVQPLVRFKKKRVDEEAMVLQAIRQEKIRVVATMKENQKRYMQGIEDLNKIRGSRSRDNLETMEQALDHVKAEWFKLFKKVQEIEGKETAQVSHVLTAERELKSVEKLQEKYEIEFKQLNAKHEQKQLDELAIRRFKRG